MTYVISDECMACGRCAENCPTQCIKPGEIHYEIDPNECVQCETCMSVCPIGAISKQ